MYELVSNRIRYLLKGDVNSLSAIYNLFNNSKYIDQFEKSKVKQTILHKTRALLDEAIKKDAPWGKLCRPFIEKLHVTLAEELLALSSKIKVSEHISKYIDSRMNILGDCNLPIAFFLELYVKITDALIIHQSIFGSFSTGFDLNTFISKVGLPYLQ
jgi:hypothetical protein